MSAFEIERGQKAHCRELNSGKYATGFFLLDDKKICADLFAYNEYFHISTDEPIHLHTEKNNIVSLHLNVDGSTGTSSRRNAPNMTVYHQHIISNTAVIGNAPWQSGDLIKNVVFTVNHTDELLRHQQKTEALFQSKIGDGFPPDIFSVQVEGITFRAGYNATYSLDYDHPKEVWPYIEIEFNAGITLLNYLDHVNCIIQLFAASLAVYLKPSDIKICRLSHSELRAAVEGQEPPEYYAVEYVWPEIVIDQQDPWVGHSFLRAWDDSDLAALQACLCVWVERHSKWKKANALMMSSLSLKREISPYRMLAAWRWFEEIPIATINAAMDNNDIAIISEAASNKAIELGYGDIKNRIIGSLKSIKSETHRDHFLRLVNSIKAKFGNVIVATRIIDDLMHAVEFRGKIAHGQFSAEAEPEFRLFAKSIRALEALCFLLTVRDLPISNEGKARITRNPLLVDYKMSA